MKRKEGGFLAEYRGFGRFLRIWSIGEKDLKDLLLRIRLSSHGRNFPGTRQG
jgi:hypothetical protein